jgi:hypothetical protein
MEGQEGGEAQGVADPPKMFSNTTGFWHRYLRLFYGNIGPVPKSESTGITYIGNVGGLRETTQL